MIYEPVGKSCAHKILSDLVMSKILSKQREQRNSNRRQPKQAQKVLEQNSRIISAKNKSRKSSSCFI